MARANTPQITSEDVEARQRALSGTAGAEAPELRQSEFHVSDLDIVKERDVEYAAREAKFMEEKVEILIEMDDNPDAPVFVMLGHNGVNQYVQRGTPQVVKRKFLYSALAAKILRWSCSFGKDGSGKEFNRMSPNVSTHYRVQLVNDPNPQGGPRWVRSVMANG